MQNGSIRSCKISVLASGSKGNSSLISYDDKVLLVDAGLTSLYIETNLHDLGINKIDYVILTHTHTDHIGGLKVLIKKYNPKVFLTEKMLDEMPFKLVNYEFIEDDFNLDNLNIEIIKTSHDVADSNGYIFTYKDYSIAYITDTGYINVKNHEKLKNKNTYIIESNHDVEKLMNGKYPYHLKQRILSDYGHLSNKDCSYYLKTFIGEKTKNIILIHLSEENNTEELAQSELEKILKKIDREDINVIISKQKERTEVIEV